MKSSRLRTPSGRVQQPVDDRGPPVDHGHVQGRVAEEVVGVDKVPQEALFLEGNVPVELSVSLQRLGALVEEVWEGGRHWRGPVLTLGLVDSHSLVLVQQLTNRKIPDASGKGEGVLSVVGSRVLISNLEDWQKFLISPLHALEAGFLQLPLVEVDGLRPDPLGLEEDPGGSTRHVHISVQQVLDDFGLTMHNGYMQRSLSCIQPIFATVVGVQWLAFRFMPPV